MVSANNEIVPLPQTNDNSIDNTALDTEQNVGNYLPFPPASVLNEYEQVNPGTSQRIIDVFFEESEHRRQMEKKIVENNLRLQTRGQIIGTSVIISVIICGTVVALAVDAVAGCTLATAGLAGGGVSYVFGYKRSSNKED